MRLIKHDVTCRAHLPSHWIEDVIRLCTLGVADEEPGVTPVGELVDVAELLHKHSAAEHAQVIHCRLLSMPSLIGCAIGKALRREPVL
jgi:GTP cyclohydrolase FolE2